MANSHAQKKIEHLQEYEAAHQKWLQEKAQKEEEAQKEPAKRGRPKKDAEKKPTGRPKGALAPGSRPDLVFQDKIKAAAGENAKFMAHSLAMWDWERPDMMDHDAVIDRIKQYFELCAHDDMRPSIEGLAVAFDCDRRQLYRWAFETHDARISQKARQYIKRAYTTLNLQLVDFLQNGKVNPVAAIFLLKNNQGYEDKTEMVLRPESQNAEVNPDQIEQYLSTTADVVTE